MANLSEKENDKKEKKKNRDIEFVERIIRKKKTLPVNAGKQILESLAGGSIYLTAPKTSHLCLLLPEIE
jgi:hypothetical protein